MHNDNTAATGIGVLLLIATGVNAALGVMIALLAWDRAHRHIEAWADFGIAMKIAAWSLPISGLCLAGLSIALVFRVGASQLLPTLRPSLIFLAAFNLLAPVALWYALKLAAVL